MVLDIWSDMLFGALASVGFATISNLPVKSLKCCGLIAGLGHGSRFWLMHHGAGIVPASFAAAFVIGILAVLLARRVKCPPEGLSFPALLPMIPGMYAYRMVRGLIGCMDSSGFNAAFDVFSYNLIITLSVILVMVIGITIPVFMLRKISFIATK